VSTFENGFNSKCGGNRTVREELVPDWLKTQQENGDGWNNFDTPEKPKRSLTDEDLKKIGGKFGERDIYYCDKKPKTFEHKLTMSEFLAKMSTNGFKIIDVDIEYKGFEEEYHLRPDMRIITEYYNEKYVIIVEVDITKEFSNMDKYNLLVDNIRKGQHRDCVPYPFLIVSVCNRKPQVTGSCNPLHIRKDLSDFSKFVWAFAKK
jgi:hypothetical protein